MNNRKVFISFLGSNNYSECRYNSGVYTSQPVRYIQEAMLDMFSKTGEWDKDDVAYILLTEGAKRRNWHDDGHTDRATGAVIKQQGLESRLAQAGLAMTVETICDIPDGNDEKEILEIFQLIYSQLRRGDELYLDITHGFRYLPMLFIALGEYAKTLLGCNIAGISYGNYEARDAATNTARIVDLLALAELQQWSMASDTFVRYGDADALASLATRSLAPILREAKGKNQDATTLSKVVKNLQQVIDDMRTCRGISIVNGTAISGLKTQLANLDEVVVPLLCPIIDYLGSAFEIYGSEPSYVNGIEAAKWCFSHGLVQQAVTILYESIVTCFCMRYGLDFTKRTERNLVNNAFNFKIDSTPEYKWRFDDCEDPQKSRNMVRRMMSDEMLLALYMDFSALRELRNDFSHSGMRANASPAQRMLRDFGCILQNVEKILAEEHELPQACESTAAESQYLYNISNHPSACWSDEQLQAAGRYGSIVDVPFPDVDPNASEDVIKETAKQVVAGLPKDVPITVHVMGEMTLCFAIVNLCKDAGIPCVASTSERIAEEDGEGNKTSTFRFTAFRNY